MELAVLPGLGGVKVGTGIGPAGDVHKVGVGGVEQIAGVGVVVVGLGGTIR